MHDNDIGEKRIFEVCHHEVLGRTVYVKAKDRDEARLISQRFFNDNPLDSMDMVDISDDITEADEADLDDFDTIIESLPDDSHGGIAATTDESAACKEEDPMIEYSMEEIAEELRSGSDFLLGTAPDARISKKSNPNGTETWVLETASGEMELSDFYDEMQMQINAELERIGSDVRVFCEFEETAKIENSHTLTARICPECGDRLFMRDDGTYICASCFHSFHQEEIHDSYPDPKGSMFCPRCNRELEYSDLRQYPYQCPECDEDFYSIEVQHLRPITENEMKPGATVFWNDPDRGEASGWRRITAVDTENGIATLDYGTDAYIEELYTKKY